MNRIQNYCKRSCKVMNFVFISPNFPDTFRRFCAALRQNGVNVLGIGDAPYSDLHPELKAALTEYYRVPTLENYDEVYRAMGYFTFKYGKLDWLESNNEYWLVQDARLRTDFNITTGPKLDKIDDFKSKYRMKEFYRAAGIPCARCEMLSTLENARAFAKQTGYPIVVKPESGVGAEATYRMENDAQLAAFFQTPPQVPYVLEEFVPGIVTTYDGICDSHGEPLFAASHIAPNSIMDMVNEGIPVYYYVDKAIPPEVEKAGRATLAAFGVKSRFFHLEFFRLTRAKKGLGKKGDIVALEVNMRPAGGFTTEMFNYGQSVDVYQMWADMVAFDELRHTYTGPKSYCVYVGRRDGVAYKRTLPELEAQYQTAARLFTRMPDALAGTMGNQVGIACFDTLPELDAFVADAFALQ